MDRLQQLVTATFKVDLYIQNWLQTRHIDFLDTILGMLTNLGSPLAYVLIAILVGIGLGRRKRYWEAIFSLTCLLSAWFLMHYLKNVFERPRPLGEALTMATGFSFPSGHAMLSTAYYGFLVLLLVNLYPSKWNRIVLLAFMVLLLLIGFSRIYLNVHYTSDVLAGYLLGALTLAANWGAMKLAIKRFRPPLC